MVGISEQADETISAPGRRMALILKLKLGLAAAQRFGVIVLQRKSQSLA
jgi:hypothetical protein